MADAEEDKKNEDGQDPNAETILAEKQRDPEEAVVAEDAIHGYATAVLNDFRDSVENALSNFNDWLASQADSATFNDPYFLDFTGQAFMQQMLAATGGAGTPIGQTLKQWVGNEIDFALRTETEASFFVNELTNAAREFCWDLRDNLQSVLGNQWDQLRDLAYEGSTAFVPVVHAFGLPSSTWDGGAMTGQLTADASAFQRSRASAKETALAQEGANPQAAAAAEQSAAQQQMLVDDEKLTIG